MIDGLFFVALITLLPFFELRLSIPLGILDKIIEAPFGLTFQGFALPWFLVFIVAVATNIVLGPIIYLILKKGVAFFTRIASINYLYNKMLVRTQKRIHPLVERYGTFGLALFIAFPLPGSGSYTGALAAYILGMSYKRFVLVNAVGVTIAGTIVTIATLGVLSIF